MRSVCVTLRLRATPQPDGSLKITGCSLLKSGQSA
jgi:hypothetical protein